MRREWIEIAPWESVKLENNASPSMRREWIEIDPLNEEIEVRLSLPPCGGSGLKFQEFAGELILVGLPPCGGSGLK